MMVADLEIDLPELLDATDLWDCLSSLRPRRRQRMIEWCVDNIKTHLDRPYSDAEYPHSGAPGGPCDAVDDHRVQTIALQFGAQVSKTFFGQNFTLFKAATDPAPTLFTSSIETVAKQVVERTYAMIHNSRSLNRLLLKSEREQRQGQIEFRESDVYVGWSKSVSTLADKTVRWGHANEVDKWEQVSTSKEAEPLKLFMERFKQYLSTMKAVLEGTPTIRGRSRIEALRLSGTNCQYFVPCPHCHGYQVLVLGGKDSPHGIHWDADDTGHSNPATAFKTARYVCIHCGGDCLEHHRPWMIRNGVWIPEGCEPDHAECLRAAKHWREITQRNLACADPDDWEFPWQGWERASWIKGTPVRDGTAASYHLPSWYSLNLGWGHVAQEFVASCKRPQDLRNFMNSWAAETWELVHKKQTWEQLGERIIGDVPRKTVPAWASLVTIGCDKQLEHYVYVVKAWGPGRRNHTLDYGTIVDLDDLQDVIATKWPREHGGTEQAACSLIDSNYRPRDVHGFIDTCRRAKLKVIACRGSNRPLGVAYIKRKNSDQSANPGRIVVEVDTFSSQDELDRRLHVYEPGQPGAMSLFRAPLYEHRDYLEQLLNDAPGSDLDSTNHVREFWQRIDADIPNDYRDCERYADIAMQLQTRGKDPPPRKPHSAAPAVTPAPADQPQSKWLPQLPKLKPFTLPGRPQY